MSDTPAPEWDYERAPRQRWAVSSVYAEGGATVTTTHGVYRSRRRAERLARSRRRYSAPDEAVYVRAWPTPGLLETPAALTREQVHELAAEWRRQHATPKGRERTGAADRRRSPRSSVTTRAHPS